MDNNTNEVQQVLLRRPQVETMTNLSTTSIYRLMRGHRFPAPLKIGGAVRWRADEIEAWINGLERSYGDLVRASGQSNG